MALAAVLQGLLSGEQDYHGQRTSQRLCAVGFCLITAVALAVGLTLGNYGAMQKTVVYGYAALALLVVPAWPWLRKNLIASKMKTE